MASFLHSLITIYILWIFKFHILHAFHMLNTDIALKQYTFYYTSTHYDIPNWSFLPNNTLQINLHNTTLTYNSSLILSIDDIHLHYHQNYDFNEVQLLKEISPIHSQPTNTRRRLRRRSRRWRSRRRKKRKRKRKRKRRKKKKSKKKKKRRKKKRSKRKKQRTAVARWLKRWKARTLRKQKKKSKSKKKHKYRKNRYATQGRFVGYLKGSRRGSTYVGAHKYCKRKYGELASIGNKHENEQVKRVCRTILGDNRKNGYYCWIGLYKPWKKWTDNRRAQFANYAAHQKSVDHKGTYTGKDKCVSMYKRTGNWYHQRCNYRNGVVCSKPRGIYVEDFIVVQKQYRYRHAKKVCTQWYGTSLATIHNVRHNRAVRKACGMAAKSGHCWIGLEAPFKTWSDGIKVKYANWAPGEPNNKGKEQCAEIYPSSKWNNIPCRVHRFPVCNGKTLYERMDPKVRQYLIKKQYMEFRRSWLKNQQRRWMAKKKRKKSFEYNWKQSLLRQIKGRAKERFKDNMDTKFFNARFGLKKEKRMGYEPLMTKQMLMGMYYQKYGKLPKVKDPPWMKAWLQRLRGTKGKHGRMGYVAPYHMHKFHNRHVYGDLDHEPFGKGQMPQFSIGPLKGMNRELRMQARNARGYGFNGGKQWRMGSRRLVAEEDDLRKCVMVNDGSSAGMVEVCVGNDYLDLKRFERRVVKDEMVVVNVEAMNVNEISNRSDVSVDYIDFENWKYGIVSAGIGMEYERGAVIGNIEDEVYYAGRYEFITDVKDGMKECWEFRVDEMVLFCVEVSGDSVGFDIGQGSGGGSELSVAFGWGEDRDWDEVNRDVNGEWIEKCVHLSEMKICVNVEYDEFGEIEIREIDILTLSDHDQDQHVFF